MEKVGNVILEWLKSEKLTQAYLADKLGVSQPYINKILKGSNFGANSAKKWSDTFGFSLSFLLTGEGTLFDNDESLIVSQAHADLDEAPPPLSGDAEYWKAKYEEKVKELERVRGTVDGLQMALDTLRGVSVPSAEPIKKSV